MKLKGLESYYVKVNLLFPILAPSIIGGIIFTVSYYIGQQLLSPEYDTLAMILAGMVAFIYVIAKSMYNIALARLIKKK